MTNEEAIRKVLDRVLWTENASDDNKRILTNALIEALEEEPCNKQRYVVRGINNDKIEFVDKYSVRAFNRYVEFIKHDKDKVLDEIRAKMENSKDVQSVPYDDDCYSFLHGVDRCLGIIDKYQLENEEREERER